MHMDIPKYQDSIGKQLSFSNHKPFHSITQIFDQTRERKMTNIKSSRLNGVSPSIIRSLTATVTLHYVPYIDIKYQSSWFRCHPFGRSNGAWKRGACILCNVMFCLYQKDLCEREQIWEDVLSFRYYKIVVFKQGLRQILKKLNLTQLGYKILKPFKA